MNSFYISMIFLGIIFIVASLAFIMLDKRSAAGLLGKMEEKSRDIESIINDAEQMTEELNKFSDYMIARIEEKNQELQNSLKTADYSIKRLALCNMDNEKPNDLEPEAASLEVATGASVITASPDTIVKEIHEDTAKSEAAASAPAINAQTVNTPAVSAPVTQKQATRQEMVIKLNNDGLNETEIARVLNMGKGEIQLILELNK